jgi:hypothetical protein
VSWQSVRAASTIDRCHCRASYVCVVLAGDRPSYGARRSSHDSRTPPRCASGRQLAPVSAKELAGGTDVESVTLESAAHPIERPPFVLFLFPMNPASPPPAGYYWARRRRDGVVLVVEIVQLKSGEAYCQVMANLNRHDLAKAAELFEFLGHISPMT